MFHYATLPRSYSYSSVPLDPRDRYLAALASARATETEYLAAEAAQREEVHLRRRLQELQHRKFFQSRYDYGLSPNYDPYFSTELRRQAELEEQLRLVALKEAELAERRRREEAARQLEEARLRRAREERLRLLLEEEQARYDAVLTRPVRVVQHPRVGSNEFTCQRPRQQATSPFNSSRQALKPAVSVLVPHLANDDSLTVFVKQLLGSLASETDAVKPKDTTPLQQTHPRASTSQSQTSKPAAVESNPAAPQPEPAGAHQRILEQFLPFLGLPVPRSTDSASTPVSLGEFEKLLAEEFNKVFGHAESEPVKPAATTSSVATQSSEKSPKAIPTPANANTSQSATGSLKEQLEARLNNEFHSEVRDTIQAIFASLQDADNNDSASSTSPKPSASGTKETVNGGASSQPANPRGDSATLKEQLEARLNNEFDVEVRDTIQAIFASLQDAGASTQSGPSSSSGKGKAKAGNSSTATDSDSVNTATSKSVANSLDQVRNIEAAFHALESDFTFPLTLDFITAHLSSSSASPDSASSSDSESSSVTTHLAYTSRNHPVRFYEQALGALLTQLDSIESFGNETLRATRKEVVDLVEKALEELEKEVDGRWRARVAKEAKKAAPAPAEQVEAEPKDEAVPSESPSTALESEPTVETDASPAEAEQAQAIVTPASDAQPQPEVATTPSSESSAQPEAPSDSPVAHNGPTSETLEDATTPAEAPASADEFPPSLSASSITVKGYEVSDDADAENLAVAASPTGESGESTEAFLLASGGDSEAASKRPNYKDNEDAVSDWSEVEA
ncbi:hypothetical protein H0H92_004587 [Tricholoma furcatifolium]|nr:hypothetical protein H0H92_004587 [Tricholoma furcatifolium]